MTSRTACHHFLASDLVIGLSTASRSLGIDVGVLPLHIEYLGLRPDKLLRVAVARDAPFHLQRVFLINGGHVVDLAVTRRAPDALCDVNAVIEIREFGQVVNAFPLDRFVVAEAGPHRLKIRAVGPDLAVAVHAGLRRRHPGRCGRLHCLMAITAIDPVVADVMLMAELHRLLLLQKSVGEIRRACDLRVNVESRPG